MTTEAAVLEDRGALRVAGEDAASFLQGLLTNDVVDLAVGAARYAALLSPQGKILFDFLIVRIPVGSGAAFLIDVPAAQLAELARRLGFYRLRARVTIADESPDWTIAAFWARPPPSRRAASFIAIRASPGSAGGRSCRAPAPADRLRRRGL